MKAAQNQVEQIVPPESGYKKPPPQEAGFAAETAKAAGQSKQDINRHLSRAEALGGDMQEVVGTMRTSKADNLSDNSGTASSARCAPRTSSEPANVETGTIRAPEFELPKRKRPASLQAVEFMVARDGIEPPTRGFSVPKISKYKGLILLDVTGIRR